MKAYQILDFSHLLGMAGFSDTLLKNHFTLYQGYVTNTNKVMEPLADMVKEGKKGDAGICRAQTPPWVGIQRHAPARTLLCRTWGATAIRARPPL